MHPGLLGQDALVVHDESHLMPAFGQSLRQIHQFNQRSTPLRPFYALDLSATGTGQLGENPLKLSADDYACSSIRRRLDLDRITGQKRLHFDIVLKTQEVVTRFVQSALRHEDMGGAVLIYVRTVTLARKIQDALGKALMDKVDQGENRLLIAI